MNSFVETDEEITPSSSVAKLETLDEEVPDSQPAEDAIALDMPFPDILYEKTPSNASAQSMQQEKTSFKQAVVKVVEKNRVNAPSSRILEVEKALAAQLGRSSSLKKTSF